MWGVAVLVFFSLFQRRFYSPRGRNTFSALYIDSSRRFLAWPHSADPNSTKLLFFLFGTFYPLSYPEWKLQPLLFFCLFIQLSLSSVFISAVEKKLLHAHFPVAENNGKRAREIILYYYMRETCFSDGRILLLFR